jgi:hypothetical protein
LENEKITNVIHSEAGLIHNFDPPKTAGFDESKLVKHNKEEELKV